MTPRVPAVIRFAFRPRPVDANKYTVGTVVVVGGCERYAHAPVLAALGARAAGAGLVQLVAPDFSRAAAAMHVPEATFRTLTPKGEFPRADVVVAGMGLGVSAAAGRLVARILDGSFSRVVLDADALAALAAGRLRRATGVALVITPHEGEAARLLGWTRERVASARTDAARELAARYDATAVLKGPHTLVVSPDGVRAYENGTGNPFMALGGMGDLLSGVVGARWASVREVPEPEAAFRAAAASVWLHGAASDGLVADGRDPSLAATAAEIGALRVRLERKERAAGA